MNKISVGIYDEHKITQDGLNALLRESKEIEVNFNAGNTGELIDLSNSYPIHVLIVNVHNVTTALLNLLIQFGISHPKVKILIISVHNDENTVLRVIKIGAKGFLSRDSGTQELIRAIFSLRNGHDYFSEPITNLLLKKYISKIQDKQSEGNAKLKNLSSREVEIVKLWGQSQTNKEIAEKLFISVRTVESHKNHIMQKLNLKTAVDLVKFAIKNNIIELN